MNDRLLANPFRDAVVQDAWQSPIDVPEIHRRAFCECRTVIESIRGGVPDSLLLYGPAGAGKTHLLTRLQRHLHREQDRDPDQRQPCVFVFVRLQTSSRLLWQHVRRLFASDLTRRAQGSSQIERLLAQRLRVSAAELGTLRDLAPEMLLGEVEEMRESAQLPHDLAVVLEHLAFGRNVRHASAWLKGDSLPEATLSDLGLGHDPSSDREQAAREVVSLLCRMVATTMPVVFCFDQLEALQRDADDCGAFFHFAQMAAELHDCAPSVGLITCLQSAVLDQFKCAVRQADFQRIARRHAVLHSLTRHQVSALVLSRLQLLPSFAEHADEQPYHPFTSVFVSNLADEAPSVPRRIFNQCAREFDELQARVDDQPSMEEFLAAELAARRLQAQQGGLEGESLRILTRALPVIASLHGAEVRADDPEGADWIICHRSWKVAVTLPNDVDGRASSLRLKAPLHGDPRLEPSGARVIEPTPEMLAALDALQLLLGDAKSGDLARGGEAVDPGTVLAWLKAGLSIGEEELEPVHRFWCAVTGVEAAPSPARAVPARAAQRRAHREDASQVSPRSAPLRRKPAPNVADPERIEAELATFQSGRMPLETAVAMPLTMDGEGESGELELGADPEVLWSRSSVEAGSRRSFWSLFGRRRREIPQRSDVAAATRLASILRG